MSDFIKEFVRDSCNNSVVRLENPMPEHPDVLVEMGTPEGNSTLTKIILQAGGGTWNFDSTEDGLVIEAHGDWEREGLIKAFQFAADSLRRYTP